MRIVIDVAPHPPALAALRQRTDCEIRLIEPPEERARELDPGAIRGADILFCTFPPTNHEEMPALKWIQVASVGIAQVSGIGLPDREVRVTNARGCFDVPIAEWTVAMMVNLARDLRQMIRNQDTQAWDRSAVFQNEIRGSTVGIWGYGGIGRETARLARAMGMRVHAMTRSGTGPRGNHYAVPGTGDPDGNLPHKVFSSGEELEFLSGLDFLVIALPLTQATQGLIGEKEFQALPKKAFILNPARGPIIQEAALIKALAEKWISGAALDTHYKYPMPPDHPLWKFPNVIFTPHISGSSLSPRFKERLWDIFTQNLDRFLCGQPLVNAVPSSRPVKPEAAEAPILATAVVPWTADWEFDAPSFRRQVETIARGLTRSIYIFGTAGEGYAVNERQFDTVTAAFARDAAACGAAAMVGVISLSLSTIIERIGRARDLGIRQFQLSLPSWGALADGELDSFFAETCGRFPDCSFLHYNLLRTKRLLKASDYRRLSEAHPNLVAVKSSTDDPMIIDDLLSVSPRLRFYFTEFGYALARARGAKVGLLISLASAHYARAHAFVANDDAAREKDILELRQMVGSLKQIATGHFHIDGAYDKLLYRLSDPSFPLRLLPPYASANEADFERFRASLPPGWRTPAHTGM